jgi:hypothetical protein
LVNGEEEEGRERAKGKRVKSSKAVEERIIIFNSQLPTPNS